MPHTPASTPAVVRPFRRDDRDQLTDLVNAHVAAVVPGAAVSTHQLLGQLEREPGEYVVDPWVAARHTLVAELRGRVTAAAHLLLYGAGEEVGPGYRGAGELRWLVAWPDSPQYEDATPAAADLLGAAVALLRKGGAARVLADGALPAPGVYGVPAQWPHVEALLTGAGFVPDRAETVHLADVATLTLPPEPWPGLELRRSVGGLGTVLAAMEGERRVGWIEVCTLHGDVGRTRGSRWADVGNLWVDPEHRRRGLGRWLVGRAAGWCRLGGADRLLSYTDAWDDTEDARGERAFHDAVGFVRLTTTRRGWEQPAPGR